MKKIEILQRDRIHKALESIDAFPLTIVEAPMGFGKTTAVRSYLSTANKDYLWIAFLPSLEPATFFWEKFTAEIGHLNAELAIKLSHLGFPTNAMQLETVLSLFTSDLFPTETILVIDDFHLCTEPSVANLIMQIVAEQAEYFHIVLITRDTSYINFAELLSKGKCCLISQQKLKFTKEEIRDYCVRMRGSISQADLQKICEYTDGWISLVYMILLGLDSGLPVGMNHSIYELVELVLFNQYDEKIQNFLLELSFMDVFTAEQALFVTQEAETKQILKKIHRENSFVFFDYGSKTYQIHNVLLDFLRIHRELEFENSNRILRRLGEWYLKNNDFITAYGHFNRAGDSQRILSLLNDPKNIRNELSEFEGSSELFNRLPQDQLNQYPIAYLQHIVLSIFTGNEETVLECAEKLQCLKQVYEDLQNIDEEYRNRIIAEILIIERFTTFNIWDPADASNKEILRRLKGQHSYVMKRENEFTFGSPHLLYVYFRDEGSFSQISQLAIERFMDYAKFADGCGTGSEYLILAEYALETCDFKETELNCLKAIYKATTKAQTSIMICANFTLMRLYIVQGNVSKAIALLKELETAILQLNSSLYNTTIDMCKGYIYSCLDQAEKAPYWLQTGEMTKAEFFYQGIAFNYLVYGKCMLASKNYIALEVLTESLDEYFSIFSNQLGFLHNHIFKAVAKCNLYGIAEGALELKKALAKGQADDIVMPFVEHAPHLLELLKSIQPDEFDSCFLDKVRLYSEQYLESLQREQLSKVKLSNREVEVLSLLAEGLKQEEIAACLFLSRGTVKTHLQNIYQKLEVRGKTSAIKIAQMHKLI